MRPTDPTVRPAHQFIRDILTFDKLLTGPVLHLIYWAGLGLIVLFGFTLVGAAIGVALRDLSLEGFLIAIPVLVAGLLVLAALVLLWRGFCEFYMAVFRIAEDLSQLRAAAERDAVRTRTSVQQPPPSI
ncbi:MAG: DUF4282 domain-containing protein [Caulobacteraceae bacterium]